LRLAALLHDVGHGWFGHLGEDDIREVYGTRYSHEKFLKENVIKYFKDDLDDYFKNTPYSTDDLVNLIMGKSNIDVLDRIIVSTFDADKIEYLLRDSRMTGREYGIDVDKDTFFRNLIVDDNGILYIKEDVVSALERIAEARYHMYKEVYSDFEVRCYETLFKEALKMWINEKGYITLTNDKYVNFLLKDDNTIFQEMENDLKKEEFKSNISDECVNFLKSVIAIIKGVKPLPPRVLVKLKRDRKSEDEMSDILKKIEELNTSEFQCHGVIDTYDFSPYKKDEESYILIQTKKSYHIKPLSKCSPFIEGFQSSERYHEYNVRICFLDINMKDMVMETIESLVKGVDPNYEVKEYGFEK
jgi:HD superfamily phosphohydrolase